MSSGLRIPLTVPERSSVLQTLSREYKREKNLEARQRELKVKMMKDKEEEKAKAEIEKMADENTLQGAQADFHAGIDRSSLTDATMIGNSKSKD